jgi:hypothetical protein
VKRILLIGGRTVSVYEAQGGRLSEPQIYAQDGEGLAAFGADLLTAAPRFSRVVCDLTEEQFTAEHLPHVLPAERRHLLARKLEALYRDTPYRCAWPQGREPAGRRDDRYLFAALTQPGLISPWIEALHARQQPLEGLQSVALLSEGVLHRLRLEYPHLLLVSLGGMSGLRQSFFTEGRLVVSRITPARRLSPAEYAAMAVHETGRMLAFLQNSHALPESAVLHTVVLGGQSSLRALPAGGAASSFLRFYPLHLAEAAARLGQVPPPADDDQADALWAGFAARHRPANAYAGHDERRYVYHRWAAWGMQGAAALLLTAAGAAAFGDFTRASTLLLEHGRLAQEARQLAGAPQTLTRDSAGLTGQQLQAVVERHRGLAQTRILPNRAVAQLGQVLQAMPDITVEQLRWRAPVPRDPFVPPVDEAAAAAAADTEGATPGLSPEALRMEASLEPMGVREALARIEALTAALSALPGVSAKALQLPVALASDQALTGGGGENQGKRLQFSLHIEWQPPAARAP